MTAAPPRRGCGTRALRAVTLAAAAVVVALVAVTLYAAWDARHHRPDRVEMEALVGVPLGEPTFWSTRGLHRWRRTLRVWWTYYTLPIPNQMALWVPEDTWTYPFGAAPPFAPPPDSPLVCERGGAGTVCEAEGPGGWSYRVAYDRARARGALTARLRR